MLNTILFDLDGTLLPFQQGEFIQTYMKTLVQFLIPMGYDGAKVKEALWRGTGKMMKNDGQRTNRQVFWESFCQDLGTQAMALEGILEGFYLGEFDKVRCVLREQTDRRELILSLRRRGYTVVLATSPVFPEVAVDTRSKWAGLDLRDFDHVTTYENCRYTKPHPGYYRELLALLGKQPEECVMIGNNPVDDMYAKDVGIPCRLLMDYLENPTGEDISSYQQDSYPELEQWLMSLPKISK